MPAKPGGAVLYFHKPADALAPAGTPAAGPQPWKAAPPTAASATFPVPPADAPVAPPPALPVPGGQLPGSTKIPPVPATETMPPPRSDVFQIPNDAELERVILERLRADASRAILFGPGVRFPPLPDVGAGATYAAKTGSYPPARVTYEPLYIVHRRLHFEEKNAERYGWDLGIVQPLVSTLYFYKDVLCAPNSLGAGCAYGFWDTNAGKCLPGSPTPYFLYPPGLTITGTAAEAALVTGAVFIFP